MRAMLRISALEWRLIRRNYKVLGTHLAGALVLLLLLRPQLMTRPPGEIPGMICVILVLAAAGPPLSIGVHTLVTEKDRGTMEALALLPINRMQLVAGKAIVTLAFSVAEVTVIAVILRVAAMSRSVPQLGVALDSPLVWLVLCLLCPALSLLLTLIAVTVSGRSQDAHTASNVTMVIAAPVVFTLIGLWFGLLVARPRMVGLLIVVFAASCAVMLRASAAWLTDETLIARRH